MLEAIWRRVDPVGYSPGLISFATIASPLIAGFSLTTVVTLVSGKGKLGYSAYLAILALVVSATMMLYALQVGLAASQRTMPPDQRLAQFPEAKLSPEWLAYVRENQWRDAVLAERLLRRTRWSYNAGILMFLAGLFLVVIPGGVAAHTSGGRLILLGLAAIIAAVAILLEFVLIFDRPSGLSQYFLPGNTRNKNGNGDIGSDLPPRIDPGTLWKALYGPGVELSQEPAD